MKAKLSPLFCLACLFVAGCAVEEVPSIEGTVQCVMENDDTRTSVTDEGSFTWSSGDEVWLHTTGGGIVGTLSSGAGTASAVFSYGGFVGEMTGKAVYPYNSGHSVSDDVLSIVLPSSYDLGSALSNTNAAMYGEKSGDNIMFNHLAGVMRFIFKNVPAGTDSFIITLDKKINGTFEADLTEEYPTINAEEASSDSEKSVTLNFDAVEEVCDITLYVPLPVGTYNTLGLSLKAGDESVWTYSNTVTNAISRKTLKLMPTVSMGGSIGGDIEGGSVPPFTIVGNKAKVYMKTPGSLYQLAKNVIDGTNAESEWGTEVWDNVTDITISGTMDARDFNTLKWNFRKLENVDLTEVEILEYSGTNGTVEGYSYSYSANELPLGSFFYWQSHYLRTFPSELFDEGMPSLKSVKLPSSIKSIGRNALARAYNLKEIIIPEGVEVIGNFAFNLCFSLEKIYFPQSIKSLGLWSFTSTDNLKEVHISSTHAPEHMESFGNHYGWYQQFEDKWGQITREDIPEDTRLIKSYATLYVPIGCINNYQGWSSYFDTIVVE